ncbi:MAG: hypothetical protein LBM59_05485 [Ruminococcus sp.]|jgi:hypothetical protein|nr:hypothetical protein [Ruminococcus sp.]
MKLKRLDGTVLILVVAFMLILIVFCMATLAMVSTANKRAILKFEENQSFYTAASALDVFANGTLSDATYYATQTPAGTTPRNYINESGTPVPKLSQGRALELDLYKVAVMKKTGIGAPADQDPLKGNGKNGDSMNFFTGTYAPLNNIINAEDNDYFTAVSGGFAAYAEQFTVEPPGGSGTGGYKYAEYTMELPGVSSVGSPLGSGHNYGLFADPVTTSTGNTIYPVKITVEVIERYYNMAGVKIDALKKYMDLIADNDPTTNPTDDEVEAVRAIFDPTTYTPGVSSTYIPNATAIKDAIRAGERHKDYFRIRVTAESTLLGIPGVTAREFVIYEVPEDDFDSANTSSGGIGNGDENNAMYMTGGASAVTNLNMTVPSQIGPFYAEQDYYMAHSGQTLLSPLDYIFAKGHVIIGNSGLNDTVATNGNGAYIYGARGVYIAGAAGVGNPAGGSRPLSVLSGGTFSFSGPVGVTGDIIADGLKYHSNQDMLTVQSGSDPTKGNIHVNHYYPLPMDTDYIGADEGTFAAWYTSYPPALLSTATSITSPYPIQVAQAIHLAYDPADYGGGDPSTPHILSVGTKPIEANGSAIVYSASGANLGTVSSLMSFATNTYGYELPALVTIPAIPIGNVQLNYFDNTQYTIQTDPLGRINRQFILPNGLTLHDMPDSTVNMPTTQSKFNKLMYKNYFTPDGDIADLAADPTGATSAWDNSLVWNNPFDSNTTDGSYASYRNSSTYFQGGVAYSTATTVPNATISYYGDTSGAYPQTAIDAALRTAEAEYAIKIDGMTEATAATTYPVGSTAGFFNKHSTPATVTATKEVAAYTYTATNTGTPPGGGTPIVETYSAAMPAGFKLTSSGVLNTAALDPYNPPVVYIDANDDPIELQVNGDITGTFIILGKKKVTFIVNAASGSTVRFGNGWQGLLIMREEVYAMYKAGATFGVGDVTRAKESSIGDTYVYVSSGAKLEIAGGGGGYPTCIAANIIAFQSPVDNTANPDVALKVDYNGITKSGLEYSTIGSVTSNNYQKLIPPMNRSGNLFMKSDVPPDDGAPNFDWNSTRYLSGTAVQ